MKEITYVIKNARGIHARPASMLIKILKEFTSVPTLTRGFNTIDPRQMFVLMELGIQCGERITFTFEGDDEEAAVAALKAFLIENF